MRSGTVTCEQVRDNLAEYGVGALDEVLRSGIEAHLDACAECQRRHEELLTTGRLLDGAELLTPSRELWPEVAAALRERTPTRAPWWRLTWLRQPRWAVASALAAAATVLALAVFLPRSQGVPTIVTEIDEEAAVFAQWNAGATLQGGFADTHAMAVLLHRPMAVEEETEL